MKRVIIHNLAAFVSKVARTVVITVMVMVVALCPALTYGTGAQRTTTEAIEVDDSVERTDVSVKGEYVYITTNRQVTVSLYSILGQLIAQHNVQPGTTRIKAPARGVYILKAGSVTRRVTIN